MPNVDQSTPRVEISAAVERYRAQKQRLTALRAELQTLEERGDAIPNETQDAVARTETLLERLGRAMIALQNDHLRQHLTGGRVMVTAGIEAHGPAFVAEAIGAVRAFDTFTPDNDPYGEHDFGAVEVSGTKIFFKIDAYDRDLSHGSPDPADPELTVRVLTIMLAEEY